jgi:hypothetical protein
MFQRVATCRANATSLSRADQGEVDRDAMLIGQRQIDLRAIGQVAIACQFIGAPISRAPRMDRVGRHNAASSPSWFAFRSFAVVSARFRTDQTSFGR